MSLFINHVRIYSVFRDPYQQSENSTNLNHRQSTAIWIKGLLLHYSFTYLILKSYFNVDL